MAQKRGKVLPARNQHGVLVVFFSCEGELRNGGGPGSGAIMVFGDNGKFEIALMVSAISFKGSFLAMVNPWR